MARKTHINMMLAESYVPEWGVAEALREIVSNAIDADPNYYVGFGDGSIVIQTDTAPTFTELLLMGAGSKSVNDDNIGQNGEGLKLAALVLTRGRHALRIRVKGRVITFSLKTAKHFDRKTLHAIVEDCETIEDEGCEISFKAAGLKEIYEKGFLRQDRMGHYGPLPKAKHARGCKLFCRGVLIKTLEDASVYDWNLRNVKLNRDRNIPDMWDVKVEIARLLSERVLKDGGARVAKTILDNPNSLEAECWRTIYISDEVKKVFASAFFNKYGEQAVLDSSARDNVKAYAKGYEVVTLPSSLQNALPSDVKKASDVANELGEVDQVSSAKYADEIAELKTLLDVIGCGATTFKVFQGNSKLLGKYQGGAVWLNEELFMPGQRFERIRTMLHEMGHQKGGGDASPEFEASLDFIAAKLAERLLDK